MTAVNQRFTSVQDRILQFQSQLNRSNQKTPTSTISNESSSTTSSPRVVKILNSDNSRKSPPDNQQQDVVSVAKNAAFQKNLNNIKEAMSPKLNKPADLIINKASIPVQYQTSPVTPYQRNQQQNKLAENINHSYNNGSNSTTIQINSYAEPNTRKLQQQQQLAMMAVKKRVDAQAQQHVNSPGYESVTSDQEEEVVVTSAGSVQRSQQQPQRNLRSQKMQERNIRHGGFQVKARDFK